MSNQFDIDQESIKIKKDPTPEQEGKKADEKQAPHAQPKINQNVMMLMKVITGFMQAKWNVVVFNDTPWLYVQFWVGIFLEKPTILVVRKSDKYFVKRLKHPLVKKVIEVNSFEEATSKEVADEVAKFTKSNKHVTL